MAEIKLVFKPDVSEVSRAVQTIKQDISKSLGNIKITVDSGAQQATQNLAANLQKASSAAMEYDSRLDNVRDAAKELQKEFGNLQRIVGTTFDEETQQFTQAIAEFGRAGEEVRRVAVAFDEAGEATHSLVSGTEDVAAATKRAAREAEKAAREKEKADRKAAREQEELNKAYVQGFAQREKEVQKKQRETWSQFLKEKKQYEDEQQKLEIERGQEANRQAILYEEEAQRRRTAAWKSYFDELNGVVDAKAKQAENANRQEILDEEEAQKKRTAAWKAYFDNLNGLVDAKAKQAEMANRQEILDEEEAQRKRTAAWKAYFDNLNQQIEANQKADKARQRATETSVTLEKQYSDLIRQIQTLKAQYPEGTFDAIEQQAREARDELRNLDRTTENYAEDVNRLAKTHQSLKRDIANTRTETDKLDKVTESLWMNIQKFARWYIIGNVFTKILNSFREALSTMKEVDTELANIQKVTDRTDAEMQQLAESAYKAASAYGVTANAYLESAAEFAKAGFGDRAEELAEVAIKTQLVGDVSADVADKFLLASNAAWKMDGNLQLLNRTLDAANIIENNYATSIEKLAAGMPIAASVAANAGMTFEETIAALGTITSVTQETGTKAATALRALILNIIGAVGEYEDGIEVTEESVKSLDGILQVYAKDAMKAAEAAGTVINPMEAIAALAKASEEGLVNQAELFEILSSLGGKLRTNQLISLVQNYDMFLEMLDKTQDSAGSADKEIGIMLDTWEAKTNILQNTWTEFIAKTLDSELIKTLLDVGTAIVDFADNAGIAAVAVAGLFTLFKGKDVIGSAKRAFDDLTKSLKGVSGGFSAATTWAGLAMTAIAGAVMIYRQVEEARRESLARAAAEADEIQELGKKYTALTGQINDENLKREDLVDLLKKTTDKYNEEWDSINDLNELREKGIDLINAETEAKARQYTLENSAAYRMSQNILNGTRKVNLDAGGTNYYASYEEALAFYEEAIQRAQSSEHMSNAQIRALGRLTDEYKKLREEYDNATRTVSAYDAAVRILNGDFGGAAGHTRDLDNNTGKLTATTKSLAQIMQELSDTATKYDTAIGGVVEAMEDFGAGSIEVYNAMKSLEETIPGSTDKLYDFDTATVLAGDDIFTSKEAMLDFIDSSKQLEFTQAISELEDLADGYWDVAGAALAAMANQQAAAQMAGVLGFTTGGTQQQISQVLSVGEQIANLRQQKAEWDAQISTMRGRKDYKSGGSSASSRDYSPKSTAPERSTDTELERLKAIVSLEKAELSFLQASGKSLEEINAKRKVIQEALHKQAEYMRSVLALMDDTNSTEAERKAYEEDILALSTEWWSIQKSINDDLAKAEDERKKQLEEEAKLLEEQKKLQQEIFDTLRATVDDYYAKIISGKEKELSLEEKILAVQQAEAALANAQNERNVRYYNAAAGQWEWRANAKNVKSAQDALKRAQDALNEYQRQEAWETFKSAWEYVADQIKDGAMTFREAYDYMYDAMKGIQDKYGVDLGLTLEDSIGGFKSLNYGIDGLTQEVADSLGASVGVLRERLEEYEDAVGSFRSSFDEASDKIKNGEMSIEDAYSYLRDRARDIANRYGIDMTGALDQAIAGMDKTNMSIDELWKAVIIQLMKVNSARWFDAGTEERALLHAQNEFLGGLIGATYDQNGYWSLNGSRLYESQKGAVYDSSGALVSGPSGGGASASSSGGTSYPYVSSGGGSSSGTGSFQNIEFDETTGDPTHKDGLRPATTQEELEALRQMEDAAKRGDMETVTSIGSRLRASGSFISTVVNGKPSGILYSVSGSSNGASIYALNGEAWHTGLEAGTLLVDANGDYWKVGADGHSLTKDQNSYPSSWYAQYQREGRLDYDGVPGAGAGMVGYMTTLAAQSGQIPQEVLREIGLGHISMEQYLNSPLGKSVMSGVYDSGGILKGVGGIKATKRDELILGPELTAKATRLAGDAKSARTLDLMGGLLDVAAKSLPFAQSTVGTQYNGAVYQMGGITLTEGQARSTSVYDLAQMASGLGIFNSRI